MGKKSIVCRINYNKQRKQFSAEIFIKPKFSDRKQQISKPPTEENQKVNNQLSLIENKIRHAFLIL